MAAGLPKQFLDLQGLPILVRTCKAFLEMEMIQEMVIPVPVEFKEETLSLLRQHLPRTLLGKVTITQGGVTRQESVKAGLLKLSEHIELILIHDAARPLVNRSLILDCLQTAHKHGAAIAAIKVKDTLKQAGTHGQIEKTIDRTHLWQAQTPQVARRELLERVFHHAEQTGFTGTDEASLFEHLNIPVTLVQGSEKNFKITLPEDLALAVALLKSGQNMKIGHGYDAHRLIKGRKLILGGVEIPHAMGLDGHSDADVLSHALTDAILGSLGLGDIGRHFPDNDPRYKNIRSLTLLEDVINQAHDRSCTLSNADITLVCQQPKLAPYLQEMQDNISQSCQVAKESINIKATTTEQMGFTGRKEGIAAHAVVLMRSTHES